MGTTTDLTYGLKRTETELNRLHLTDGDPTSAAVECERSDAIGRGDWQTEVHTSSRMTCTGKTDFLVVHRLVGYEKGEEMVHEELDDLGPVGSGLTWQAIRLIRALRTDGRGSCPYPPAPPGKPARSTATADQ